MLSTSGVPHLRQISTLGRALNVAPNSLNLSIGLCFSVQARKKGFILQGCLDFWYPLGGLCRAQL